MKTRPSVIASAADKSLLEHAELYHKTLKKSNRFARPTFRQVYEKYEDHDMLQECIASLNAKEIQCYKYNYFPFNSGIRDLQYQKHDKYKATLRVANNGQELQIFNFKPLGISSKLSKAGAQQKFQKVESSASLRVAEIEGFVYGGQSSRFWMMRKHINSLDTLEDKLRLPFFCWQCISIQISSRDVDLIIPNEAEMLLFIRFLLLSLKSLDGTAGSAEPTISAMIRLAFKEKQKRQSSNKSAKKKAVEITFEELERQRKERVFMQIVCDLTLKKYRVLKTRMKISYLAYVKNMTVVELFCKTILNSYQQLVERGEIEDHHCLRCSKDVVDLVKEVKNNQQRTRYMNPYFAMGQFEIGCEAFDLEDEG